MSRKRKLVGRDIRLLQTSSQSVFVPVAAGAATGTADVAGAADDAPDAAAGADAAGGPRSTQQQPTTRSSGSSTRDASAAQASAAPATATTPSTPRDTAHTCTRQRRSRHTIERNSLTHMSARASAQPGGPPRTPRERPRPLAPPTPAGPCTEEHNAANEPQMSRTGPARRTELLRQELSGLPLRLRSASSR